MFGAIFMKLAGAIAAAVDDGIPIPHGENQTLWELITRPFTQHLGYFFYPILLGLVTGIIWIKTQSTGPAVAFFILGNAVLAAFVPGDVAMYFALFTVFAAVAVFFKALTR